MEIPALRLPSHLVHSSLLLFAVLPLLTHATRGLIGQGAAFQPKVFFNVGHSDRTERNTAGIDRIYQMVDPRFHTGWGKGAGFTIVLQDVNQSTSELVKVGYVRPDATKPDQPDVSNAGKLGEGTFKVFGTGTGQGTFVWTLTLGTRVALPPIHGMSIELPSAKLNAQSQITDGIFLHNQSPRSLQLPTKAVPKHWMYVLTAGKAANWDSSPGGTWRFGALYEAPVAQVHVLSKAYGKAQEALRGPESLFPSFTRGDRIAWDLESKALAVTGTRKPGLAVIMLGAQALNPRVKTIWGDLFLNPTSIYTMLVVLDKAGQASLPGLPIPKSGIGFHTQTLFIDPNTTPNPTLTLSDAQFLVTY